MANAETYNDQVVRLFLLAAAVWGVVGMSVGVFAAAQLAWPALNFDVPWLTFGRMRPVHTFARDLRLRRLGADGHVLLHRAAHRPYAPGVRPRSRLHVLGLAAVMLAGHGDDAVRDSPRARSTPSPNGSIDLLIAVVWVSFGVVFFGTLARRRIRHIYVANWYYGADHRGRTAAHRQQPGAAGLADQVLPDLFRRGRCDGAVVVRAQRGRVLPDRGLPRDDVLLRAAPGAAAAVELPLLDRQFLGADLGLHVGGLRTT